MEETLQTDRNCLQNSENIPLKEKVVSTDSQKLISIFKLFKFASTYDKILISIGIVSSCLNGGIIPLISILMGKMVNNFGKIFYKQDIMSSVEEFALISLYLGIGTFILSFIMMGSWIIVGESTELKIKEQYARSLMQQEMEWFDKSNPNDFISQISEDCTRVQEAVGEKIGTFLMTISMFISGTIIGYTEGWQISLILTLALPILSLATILVVVVIQKSKKVQEATYSMAGGKASQAFFSIKTVKAHNGENHETREYEKLITFVKEKLIKFGFIAALSMGFLYFCMNATYALGLYSASYAIEDHWYNSLKNKDWDVGSTLSSLFAIIFAAFSLGQASPAFSAFARGRISGTKIFNLIERVPKIKIDEPEKFNAQNLKGNIIFTETDFSYPLRPEVHVLNGINLVIKEGMKVAFVGESGCGKSTIFQLIERFYDPNNGEILIDGINIKDYNLRSLRNQFGFVGQEPILFDGTIGENLLFGKQDATEDEMITSLKQANAWDFVSKLEKKLETNVGVAGSQLSGGQKQRIAIARALIKNPKILLLDEATSALDRTNELAIQHTLDEISKGRTTLVIAHRLTTIQNADLICFIKEGKIAERGSHDELIAMKGGYAKIFERQITTKLIDKKDKDILVNNFVTENLPLIPFIRRRSSILNISFRESLNSFEDNGKISKEEKKKLRNRISSYMKPNIKYIYSGYLFALIRGLTFPFIGYFLSEIMSVLAIPMAPHYRQKANFYSGMFLMLAFTSLITNTLQLYFLEIAGQNMIIQIRSDLFKKIVNMPIQFFDKMEHSPGALATLLSSDSTYIYTMTVSTQGMIFMAVSSYFIGIIIAFTASWQLSLLNLGLSPLIFFSAKFHATFAEGFSKDFDEFYKEANEIIFEGITNIRTVSYLTADNLIIKNFQKKMEKPREKIRQKGFYAGLGFAFSNFIIFGLYSITFYVGAVLMRTEDLSFTDLFTSVFCLMFAAFASGNAAQFMPDIGKGFAASKRLFDVLDCENEFEEEKRLNPNASKSVVWGNIEFSNVSFAYPMRPNKNVLKNISFKINYGEKIAFVGSSGSGKSTILQLLLRFYDINKGSIKFNGVDIRLIEKKVIRAQFGVVSQEPVLLNGTIKYNIQYNTENATDDEIKKAAEMANALEFILTDDFGDENDDLGFDRNVGLKGGNISGGQKQRLAIARALLKNPPVLLLDEATSALDSNSEYEVQMTLDKLMENKTTIIVAHRISTIKNADRIFVLENGEIVEQGNYNQLVEMQGVFYRLERGIQV